MKRIRIIIYLFLISSLSFSCSEIHRGAIKIGALLPLTGSGALYGQYAKQGINLAVEQYNDSIGKNGKKIEVIYEDSRSNAKDGLSGFNRLTYMKVPIVFTEFSPVVMICSPAADKTKTILFNSGAQNPNIRYQGPYIVSNIIDANIEAENMAKYLISKNIKKVCTYVINTDTGVATEKTFVETFKKLGGEILLQERHSQGELDYRSTLTKLKKSDPQAVYLVSLVDESALILKQAKEINFHTQWVSYASFQGPEILKIAGSAADGTIYTYPSFNPSSPVAQDFAKEYFSKYSENPEIYASTFYDGVTFFIKALKAGNNSSEDILHYFMTHKFYGVTGMTDFNGKTWVDKPVEFKIVQGGSFRHLEGY